MRVGAVIFDLDNTIYGSDRSLFSLDRAWASIGGGRARRVQSPNELPTDVLWLTNLPYSVFAEARLNRNHSFRNDGWLRTSVAQLSMELGVHTDTIPAHETAEALADVTQRVVNVAERDFGVTPEHQYKLNEDFARVLGAPQPGVPDAHYKHFDPIARHPLVTVVQTISYGSRQPTITVRRNRVRHARDVLATPVPSETGWDHRSCDPTASDHWLEQIDTPFLAHCSISNLKPMIAEVLSWGSGAQGRRDWLTDIEWREVRKHGTVSVKEVLISKSPAKHLPHRDQLPGAYCAELSTTYGLIAEQIWTSVTNSRKYKGDEQRFSAAAAWLRSADRMIMFDYAQRLHGLGMTVMSYGVGNVVLAYPDGALKRAINLSLRVGLLPPGSKVAEANRVAVT